MKGGELIKALRKKLDKDNNAQLAEHLGISGTHPRNLENQEKDLAPHQIASIVEKAMKLAGTRKKKKSVQLLSSRSPSIAPFLCRRGNRQRLFSLASKRGRDCGKNWKT